MRSSPVSCRRFRSVRRKGTNRITPDELADLRSHYPKGCRVKLIRMNDPYRDLEAGTLGKVMHVDDIGTIHVVWDCGSTLGVAYGVDSCVVVDSEGGKQND